MEEKIQKELEKAKEYFYQRKLLETYGILRRYFDRLPFKPEKEHAQYVGMFARVLSELGKKNELNFYMLALEKLQLNIKSPEIDFQLATIYVHAEPPQFRGAMVLLERIISDPNAKALAIRAKLLLAYCYDTLNDDVASCRILIDSIGEIEDESLKYLVETWKAKVLRDERKFEESEATLSKLFKELTVEKEWYSYFIGKIIQIGLYLDWGKKEKVSQLLLEVKQLAEGKPLKSVQMQLRVMEAKLEKDADLGPILFDNATHVKKMSYANRIQTLNQDSLSDRLLLLLLEEGFLNKSMIVKALYERQYDEKKDDQLIYYHIHSLRKSLRKFGLPPEAIENDGNGYRLVPEVHFMEEL